MLPEVKAIEAQLKQILYSCVEYVQATKAALYLCASQNLNEKRYELVTHYQYNAADRKILTSNDNLVDRLNVKRGTFFVNGLGSDQRFAEILFRQGNDRLLAAPIFSRGRLVGFIDMRDKAGKKPFDTPDLDAATKIAEQMGKVLAANKLFDLAPISLVEDPLNRATQKSDPHVNAPAPRTAAPAPMTASPRPQAGQVFSAEAMKAIENARQQLAKRQLADKPSGRRAPTDGDLEVIRLLLPAALAIPGAVLACFSAIGHLNNPQAMAAVTTIGDDALQQVTAHLQAILKRANQPHMTTMRPQFIYPFGAQDGPVGADAITSIQSAAVNPATVDGLVLTVAFEGMPENHAQHAVQTFLAQIEPIVESALAASGGRNDRQLLAERLIEPDFTKYPDLANHCREVSTIAQRFARMLELPATEVEIVRLAALVHDAGLRVLDYERMYKRMNLTPEEMRGLAEHPIVGAALVEPLLGSEVAQAVLRHHERVDGKGYPSRLTGTQIPLTSRIIQLADAWVAMTAYNSYKDPVSRDKAVQRLREGSGTQFDPTLVEKFLANLTQILQ